MLDTYTNERRLERIECESFQAGQNYIFLCY